METTRTSEILAAETERLLALPRMHTLSDVSPMALNLVIGMLVVSIQRQCKHPSSMNAAGLQLALENFLTLCFPDMLLTDRLDKAMEIFKADLNTIRQQRENGHG